MITTEFKLSPQGKYKVLMTNGNETQCMDAAPMLIPSPLNPNSSQIVFRPCGSACPFFAEAIQEVKNDSGDVIDKIDGVVLRCKPNPKFFAVKKPVPAIKTNK